MRISKLRMILACVAVVLAVSAIAAIAYNVNKNARLTVIVTPIDATIKINGKQYNNGTADFFPGEVKIEVSRKDFDTKTVTVNLESHKTTTALVYLTQDGDLDYYETSAADYEILRLVADDSVAEYLEKMEKRLAIRDLLPLTKNTDADTPDSKYGVYSRQTLINDGTELPDCDRVICLSLIDNTDSDDVARALLNEYGYNFDDFKIIRIDE